jgi:ethanolamine kinase
MFIIYLLILKLYEIEMGIYCEKIAMRMAKLHQINNEYIPHSESSIIMMAKKWLKEAKHNMKSQDEELQRKLSSINIDLIEKELLYIEQLAKQCNCELVFCHNDLQSLNIIYNEKEDEIYFIDFEYSGYNYRCFDIGNHFCEYTGINDINPQKYPSVEAQRRFIRAYLQYTNMGEVTEELIERVRIESNFFSLLANIAYGIWAIPQAKYSAINFNYIEYGRKKLDFYWCYRDLAIHNFIKMQEKMKSNNGTNVNDTIADVS